jgi:hypothetical protein
MLRLIAKAITTASFLLLSGIGTTVKADETEDLKKEIDLLKTQLAELSKKVEAYDGPHKPTEEDVKEMINTALRITNAASRAKAFAGASAAAGRARLPVYVRRAAGHLMGEARWEALSQGATALALSGDIPEARKIAESILDAEIRDRTMVLIASGKSEK